MKGSRWLSGVLCSLLAVCLYAAQGYKQEVNHPRFVTANTSKIEIRRIIREAEQTVVDVMLYGEPGEVAVISSQTVLKTTAGELLLREAAHLSVDGKTEPERIGESGKHLATLLFPPVPAGVYAVDLVEKEANWKIWGVQLTEKEPYVYVPSFLQERHVEKVGILPRPALTPGRCVINGYVLGYEGGMDVYALLRVNDWLRTEPEGQSVKIRQDGSFHIELDLLTAVAAELKVNQGGMNLFLSPGEELTVYVHLPRLSMAASHLLHKEFRKSRKAWFEGKEAGLNDYWANEGYGEALPALPAAEELKELYPDWEVNLEKARTVYRSVVSKGKLESADKKLLNQIVPSELSLYVKNRVKGVEAMADRARASEGYVIEQLDSAVQGADILPAIIAAHRGRAVLVDFWATWCGPCRKSMVAIQPLKKKLSPKDVTYIYLTGPSSPELEWRTDIEEIHGIHYRLTQAQWEYLCRSYGVTGIPAYLIFSYDGKLQDRYVGFPGVEVLTKDLYRAMD